MAHSLRWSARLAWTRSWILCGPATPACWAPRRSSSSWLQRCPTSPPSAQLTPGPPLVGRPWWRRPSTPSLRNPSPSPPSSSSSGSFRRSASTSTRRTRRRPWPTQPRRSSRRPAPVARRVAVARSSPAVACWGIRRTGNGNWRLWAPVAIAAALAGAVSAMRVAFYNLGLSVFVFPISASRIAAPREAPPTRRAASSTGSGRHTAAWWGLPRARLSRPSERFAIPSDPGVVEPLPEAGGQISRFRTRLISSAGSELSFRRCWRWGGKPCSSDVA